ncbi:hypothetical protein J4407_01490 [Candidatus Pacearchaeota archaeon]|nr:hypothetical protein [Candidatus Pacearchaeota archaeon]
MTIETKIDRETTEVMNIILRVLRTEEIQESNGFVAPGIFYAEAQRFGYNGSQEKLNQIAQKMGEVECFQRGQTQNYHYKLRKGFKGIVED